MKKLAFCFLVYDVINQEDLWYEFFKNVDPRKYDIYVHYKTNTKLKYFDQHKLSNCVKTKYADVSLIHAHNLLFQKALEDGNYKIISLSQACIPVKSFNYIYEFLTKDGYGHFATTKPSQCFPRCNSLLKYYDKQNIQKSTNWFILNRSLCEFLALYDAEEIDKKFNFASPEEHYYITRIYSHNLRNEIVEKNRSYVWDSTTFDNWGGTEDSPSPYKYPSPYGLKNYSKISDEELDYLLNSNCLFARKFTRDFVPSSYLHKNLSSL